MPVRRKKAAMQNERVGTDPTATDTLRGQVRDSGILEALIEHAEGKREMTSSQVTAGLNLMKKILPDLASVQMGGETTHTVVHRIERRIVNPQTPDESRDMLHNESQAGVPKTSD